MRCYFSSKYNPKNMTSFRVRPRFTHSCTDSVPEIFNKLSDGLEKNKDKINGIIHEPHATIRIVHKNQHFWSPQLSLYVYHDDERTLMKGRYGPHPSVWVIFLFAYSILGLAFFFISTVGLVRLSLHLESQILWVLPVLIILALIAYLVAQTGQKMGVEQTFTIHHFVEDTLGEKIHIS